MAFLSGGMWDKFDLSMGEKAPENDLDFDLDAIMEETFSDIHSLVTDFGLQDDQSLKEIHDLLSFVKQEDDLFETALSEHEPSADVLNGFDSPAMDWQSSELMTIKSDCMLSSALVAEMAMPSRPRCQKRNSSLCISDCSDTSNIVNSEDLLGTSPPVIDGNNFLKSYLDLAMPAITTTESETESASTDDEEIDVVSSSDDQDPSTFLRQQYSRKFSNIKPVQKIEPGHSLLIRSHRSKPVNPTTSHNNSYLNHQTFMDHSYFSVLPPSPLRPESDLALGLLTPNESSDEENLNIRIRYNETSTAVVNKVNKQKLVKAVQSLIKDNKIATTLTSGGKAGQGENIKFKFRMKLKTNNSQRSLLTINNRQNMRRTSALKNTHCPLPATKVETKVTSSRKPPATPTKMSPAKAQANPKSSPNRTNSTPSPNQDQKFREIRDLHNSLERERRINLRQNFDQLKSLVPILVDMDKASKVNILGKASDYCKELRTNNDRLEKERTHESARNTMMRKKLNVLQNFFRKEFEQNQKKKLKS